MYACFSYSRSERWGRNKARVFQDQLRKSSLNQEKLDTMTTEKLNSLMSQIGKYLSNQKQDEINAKALQEAENDFAKETAEERGRRKEGWLLEEKWTLLWATEYAKTKSGSNKSQAYTKLWRAIMEKFCPNKGDHKKNSSQLLNVKKSGAFSDAMPYLTEKKWPSH